MASKKVTVIPGGKAAVKRVRRPKLVAVDFRFDTDGRLLAFDHESQQPIEFRLPFSIEIHEDAIKSWEVD